MKRRALALELILVGFCAHILVLAIIIYCSIFLFNSANSNQEYQTSYGDGGVLATFHGLVSVHDSVFMHNRTEGAGGAIIVFRSTLVIDQNEFHNKLQQ